MLAEPAKSEAWPKLGARVWVVEIKWPKNNEGACKYCPTLREVTSVGNGIVYFADAGSRRLSECYQTEEECKKVCPAPTR